MGGAFGLGAYTGAWRNTKDLDLYILPPDRDTVVSVLTEAGLDDYYGQLAYDRRRIYRSFTDDIIVDAVRAMANRRALVDERSRVRTGRAAARVERGAGRRLNAATRSGAG